MRGGVLLQATNASPATQPVSTGRWALPTRLGFRLAFAFYVLWFFPEPFDFSLDWVSVVLPKLVPWFASWALHASDTAPGGSAYGIARSLLLLTIALAATVIWSAADRKRHALRDPPCVVATLRPDGPRSLY